MPTLAIFQHIMAFLYEYLLIKESQPIEELYVCDALIKKLERCF